VSEEHSIGCQEYVWTLHPTFLKLTPLQPNFENTELDIPKEPEAYRPTVWEIMSGFRKQDLEDFWILLVLRIHNSDSLVQIIWLRLRYFEKIPFLGILIHLQFTVKCAW